MKIAILKADTVRPELAAHHGEYPAMFKSLLRQVDPTIEFSTYDVEHQQYPRSTDGVDAWLLTGSKASVYDDEAWIGELKQFVRRLHQEQRTLIGICFGHQLIAQALGGSSEKAAVGWGVGIHNARWMKAPQWIANPGDGFNLLVSHQDQVSVPAPGSQVLAGSEFCPVAMCQLGDHILSLQGHPEFEPEYARALMNTRRERLGEDTYQRGIATLDQASDQRQVAQWIVDFIRTPPSSGQSS